VAPLVVEEVVVAAEAVSHSSGSRVGCRAVEGSNETFKRLRGCQARRHDVEDNIMPGCQAPPLNAARIRARFPGEATFNIVGPRRLADRIFRASNNIENGTSAARGPLPRILPERMPGTRPVGRAGCQAPPLNAAPPTLSTRRLIVGQGPGRQIRNPKSEIRNHHHTFRLVTHAMPRIGTADTR
jgi:hypothetical protein